MRDSFGTMLVCDDIRYELNGKVSYMGIYEQGILFGRPAPTSISRLCVASNIWVSGLNKIDTLIILVQLEDSDQNVTDLASQSIDVNHEPTQDDAEEAGYFNYTNHFVLNDIAFYGASRLMLRVRSGDETLRCGTVHVNFPDSEPADPETPDADLEGQD